MLLTHTIAQMPTHAGSARPMAEQNIADALFIFAMNRFCGAEDIKSMRSGSDYMDRNFGTHWGVLIDELKILARAVFVLDSKGVVQYAEVVKEVASEPDYDAALAALQKLVG